MKKGDFDVSIMLIGLDPSPANVRESWGSASAGNGGSNYSYYQSKAFDAYVDTAVAQMDPVKAKAYFRKAYLTIIADAPAIWLYEPDGIAATAKRLQTAGIRADAWAMNIKDWSIAAGKP
jgi:ABC-type transport system substrate-binding protein